MTCVSPSWGNPGASNVDAIDFKKMSPPAELLTCMHVNKDKNGDRAFYGNFRRVVAATAEKVNLARRGLNTERVSEGPIPSPSRQELSTPDWAQDENETQRSPMRLISVRSLS
jgi:hypothetical protein